MISPCVRVTREFIVLDDARFRRSHASTVLPLPDGEILAAWFGGSYEGAGDVAIWCARRKPEGTWTTPERVAAEDGLPHWNPVLFADPAGPGEIHLFYKVGHRIPTWQTRTTTSLDGGRSWSEPRELVPGDVGGRGPVKNKPIVLDDGTWLAPASIEATTWDAFTDRSDDYGRTWQRSALVPIDRSSFPGEGVIQPTVWQSAPGRVHMLLRSSCGWICRSDSADNGRTWTPAQPTGLPNNNSGIDATRLTDGRIVCVHNPVHQAWGPRTPLVAAISGDNGATWFTWTVLEDEPVPQGFTAIRAEETGIVSDGLVEFSYPAVVAHNGGVIVTYTWQRRGIVFAAIIDEGLPMR